MIPWHDVSGLSALAGQASSLTASTNGVSLELFITTVTAMLGAFGVTARLLYRALNKRIQEKFEHVRDLAAQVDKSADESEKGILDRLAQYFSAHERLRDKWDEFLREYLKIDSTRGQKVDALFRVVDQMQDTFKELRPALNAKVEDLFQRGVNELKVYVRDQIREELKG